MARDFFLTIASSFDIWEAGWSNKLKEVTGASEVWASQTVHIDCVYLCVCVIALSEKIEKNSMWHRERTDLDVQSTSKRQCSKAEVALH